MANMRRCYVCGSSKEELRPYGDKGQDICFPCMMGSEDRRATAERQFDAQFSACGESVVLGSDVGPYPLEADNG